MTPKRALARIHYELVSLLLECAFAAAVLAALAAAAPLAFVLAAQINGLATTGQWHGFQFAELLDVLRTDPSGMGAVSHPVAETVLALPATLVLAIAALLLALLAVLFVRWNRRARARFFSVQHTAMIRDIERELETRS